MNPRIFIIKNKKWLRSKTYNYFFNLNNGYFLRWGENVADDPAFSPFGPELIDLEVSTICSRACPWCYKSNTSNGKNMNFETFKTIFDKIPKTLTQIAFGIGDLDRNPDLWKMLEYCRKNQVIPNITINGYKVNEEMAEKLVTFCGAIAISHYEDDYCFNAINLLKSKGLKQINIHKLLSKETLNSCYDLINKIKTDSRLEYLNAVIFLSLKKKGRGIDFQTLKKEEFSDLIHFAINQNIPIGFDSCTAPKFLKSIKNHKKKIFLKTMIEPCESSCFSLYINVEGKAYPCSFLENEKGIASINMLNIRDFLKDVWFNEKTERFRTKLIKNKRECPVFKI